MREVKISTKVNKNKLYNEIITLLAIETTKKSIWLGIELIYKVKTSSGVFRWISRDQERAQLH